MLNFFRSRLTAPATPSYSSRIVMALKQCVFQLPVAARVSACWYLQPEFEGYIATSILHRAMLNGQEAEVFPVTHIRLQSLIYRPVEIVPSHILGDHLALLMGNIAAGFAATAISSHQYQVQALTLQQIEIFQDTYQKHFMDR